MSADGVSPTSKKRKMDVASTAGGGASGGLPSDLGAGARKVDDGIVYLADAKPLPEDCLVNRPVGIGRPDAPFAGTPEEFLASVDGDALVTQQMRNSVKKCPGCGKPNAFTLAECNQCGADLSAVAIGHSNNIFSGFVYGIQKGPFPFTISLRSEDADLLVFDDLLALSPCHLNVIPASRYLPDWRHLLRDPAAGLRLVDSMYERCTDVFAQQFWACEPWRRRFLVEGGAALAGKAPAALAQELVMAGFNYPPSQYQLHLQYIVLPMTPFHYNLYLRGTHYTKGRFFPLEYVRACLETGRALAVDANTPIADVIAFYRDAGVDYDKWHAEAYQRAGERQLRWAQFRPADFRGVVEAGQFRAFGADAAPAAGGDADAAAAAEVKRVTDADKLALQSYGRPYAAPGKPTGVYYTFAKKGASEFPASL